MSILATYSYSYGVGSEPNRRIEFVREGEDPCSLYARVSVLGADSRIISSVKAYRISVEMESTSAKTKSLHVAYSGGTSHTLKVNTMDDMEITAQNEICKRIRPSFHEGEGYRIEITNDVGDPRYGYEKVVQLNLFDPS